MAFKIQIKTIHPKSTKDYEESQDPGEWVVFKEPKNEEKEEDVEEAIQRDWLTLHRIFVSRVP